MDPSGHPLAGVTCGVPKGGEHLQMMHGDQCGDLQRCREHMVPWEDPIHSLEEHGGGVAGEDACRRSRSFPVLLRDFRGVADLEESRTAPLV